MKDTGATDQKPPLPTETAAIKGVMLLSDLKVGNQTALVGDFCNKIGTKRT